MAINAGYIDGKIPRDNRNGSAGKECEWKKIRYRIGKMNRKLLNVPNGGIAGKMRDRGRVAPGSP